MQGGEENALVLLLADAPLTEVLRDGLVFVHLGAMAAAFGVALICDLLLLRRLRRVISRSDVEGLRWSHKVIGRALLVLWITGLALAAVATGMDPDNLTPKLVAKIGSVTVLMVTAGLMSRLVLPLLADSTGYSIVTLPLQRKLVFATCAGLSIAGWASAILLGESAIAKSADAEALTVLLAAIHGGAVLALLAAAVLIHGAHLFKEAGRFRVPGAVRP